MSERVFGDVKFADESKNALRDAKVIVAVDRADKPSELTTAVGGYIDRDGVFHICEVSLVSPVSTRINALRTKIKNRKR